MIKLRHVPKVGWYLVAQRSSFSGTDIWTTVGGPWKTRDEAEAEANARRKARKNRAR